LDPSPAEGAPGPASGRGVSDGRWPIRGPRLPGVPRPVRGASWLAPRTPAASQPSPSPGTLDGFRGMPGRGQGPAGLGGRATGWVSGESRAGYDPAPWLEVYRPGVEAPGPTHGPAGPSKEGAPAAGEAPDGT